MGSVNSVEIQSYLVAPWSLPLRAVCPGLSAQAHQAVNSETRAPVPGWVKPQYLYRWLSEAIAQRVAWQAAQPGAVCYRFGRRSEPCWSPTITLRIDARPLRPLSQDDILWHMGMSLERLYRITQTPPGEIGEDLWTQTLLSACHYLAVMYRTVQRRYKAQRARALLHDALRWFLTWDTADEEHPPVLTLSLPRQAGARRPRVVPLNI